MVERFSADFLPAMESYLTESHLEYCQTSTTNLLCESMQSLFGWLTNGGYVDGLPQVWWVSALGSWSYFNKWNIRIQGHNYVASLYGAVLCKTASGKSKYK